MAMVNKFWKVFEATEKSCDKRCDKCLMWWDMKQVCLHEDIANWQVYNVQAKKRRGKKWGINVSTV